MPGLVVDDDSRFEIVLDKPELASERLRIAQALHDLSDCRSRLALEPLITRSIRPGEHGEPQCDHRKLRQTREVNAKREPRCEPFHDDLCSLANM
jgi:hypothetical protein